MSSAGEIRQAPAQNQWPELGDAEPQFGKKTDTGGTLVDYSARGLNPNETGFGEQMVTINQFEENGPNPAALNQRTVQQKTTNQAPPNTLLASSQVAVPPGHNSLKNDTKVETLAQFKPHQQPTEKDLADHSCTQTEEGVASTSPKKA